MPTTPRLLVAFAAISLTATPMATAAGQFAISPFLSYVPGSDRNPYAGMALTLGRTAGGGLALRASGDMEIPTDEERRSSAVTGNSSYRVRAADADAMLLFGGLGGGMHGIRPYGFAGVGIVAADSADVKVPRTGWSYGIGAALLLGRNIDVFGEARWRMSEYVLPTTELAPSPDGEFRFGLTFRAGGGAR